METPEHRHPAWLIVAYPLLKLLFGGLLLLLGPLRMIGGYRAPRKGGLLILSNHLSDIDPVVVQIASPRLLHFMAKDELFQIRLLGAFLKAVAFPVRRGQPDRSAIRIAVKLLRAGEAVCVFPEGELSASGQLLPLLPGVGLIAKMAEAEIICVGLRNTQLIVPYGSLLPRPAFRRVYAVWGQPRRFPKGADIEEILAWARAELLSLTEAD